jgi:hypothetical protein
VVVETSFYHQLFGVHLRGLRAGECFMKPGYDRQHLGQKDPQAGPPRWVVIVIVIVIFGILYWMAPTPPFV